MGELTRLQAWHPPASWSRIRTIDLHTGGEPLRVIIQGFPPVPGKTILERRGYVEAHLDHLRRRLMSEPRGHNDMYGCLITPAVTPGADFGVIFMHNEGYSTMCGHGIIAVSKLVVETGMIEAKGEETHLVIDTPAGIVESWVLQRSRASSTVRFRNVPSFVVSLNEVVEVPGLGNVEFDLAFGGAYYAYVKAEVLGISLVPSESSRIAELGMAIKRAVAKTSLIAHPTERELGFLYGTIFVGPSEQKGVHSRNVCVFAEGQIDRSPTGTGVSGRLAIHFQRGELQRGDALVIESIIGSRFVGRVVDRTLFEGMEAVVPEIGGEAWITGKNEFLVDPNDPWAGGFLLG